MFKKICILLLLSQTAGIFAMKGGSPARQGTKAGAAAAPSSPQTLNADQQVLFDKLVEQAKSYTSKLTVAERKTFNTALGRLPASKAVRDLRQQVEKMNIEIKNARKAARDTREAEAAQAKKERKAAALKEQEAEAAETKRNEEVIRAKSQQEAREQAKRRAEEQARQDREAAEAKHKEEAARKEQEAQEEVIRAKKQQEAQELAKRRAEEQARLDKQEAERVKKDEEAAAALKKQESEVASAAFAEKMLASRAQAAREHANRLAEKQAREDREAREATEAALEAQRRDEEQARLAKQEAERAKKIEVAAAALRKQESELAWAGRSVDYLEGLLDPQPKALFSTAAQIVEEYLRLVSVLGVLTDPATAINEPISRDAAALVERLKAFEQHQFCPSWIPYLLTTKPNTSGAQKVAASAPAKPALQQASATPPSPAVPAGSQLGGSKPASAGNKPEPVVVKNGGQPEVVKPTGDGEKKQGRSWFKPAAGITLVTLAGYGLWRWYTNNDKAKTK